ncbi:hypothetical protein [Microbacterium sp. NIBRBAC000506063]|uniref:hypothetical protein n=1 Tax=Microbacterium sp. NIBRBAC000506063 TaxID=2734618 RepID=UPI001BB4AB0E|nr:hypothetical protein [Microbacterium sp. NIBRBAC000506063]QTV78951.1 hypothetical protein KAE78_07035 [Microbacterium sp. NIBRBAC000506063]
MTAQLAYGQTPASYTDVFAYFGGTVVAAAEGGTVDVLTGLGDDLVLLDAASVTGLLRIATGAGDDTVWLDQSTVVGGTRIEAGDGDDIVSLTHTTLIGDSEIFGGFGDDVVVLFESTFDGQTTVYGGPSAALAGADGDDLVIVTRITILPGTRIGDAGDAFDGLPIQNTLRIDGQNGSNHVEVTVWGIDDPLARETHIEVVGTGRDPFGINTLTINAADGDDVVLLRSVAFLPGVPEARRPAIVAVASGEGPTSGSATTAASTASSR